MIHPKFREVEYDDSDDSSEFDYFTEDPYSTGSYAVIEKYADMADYLLERELEDFDNY